MVTPESTPAPDDDAPFSPEADEGGFQRSPEYAARIIDHHGYSKVHDGYSRDGHDVTSFRLNTVSRDIADLLVADGTHRLYRHPHLGLCVERKPPAVVRVRLPQRCLDQFNAAVDAVRRFPRPTGRLFAEHYAVIDLYAEMFNLDTDLVETGTNGPGSALVLDRIRQHLTDAVSPGGSETEA